MGHETPNAEPMPCWPTYKLSRVGPPGQHSSTEPDWREQYGVRRRAESRVGFRDPGEWHLNYHVVVDGIDSGQLETPIIFNHRPLH